MGLLKGFYDKLHKQKEKSQKESRIKASSSSQQQNNIYSLIVAQDERLNDYVGMRFPRLRKLSRRGPKIYKSTYNEGIETGKKITLHKGVTKKEGNRGNLLTQC